MQWIRRGSSRPGTSSVRVGLGALALLTVLDAGAAQASALPPNSLSAEDDPFAATGISHEEFDAIIDRVEWLFRPIFYFHGGELHVERNWDDGEVNAYASRSGRRWTVRMLGGLARRSEITPDGFALVVCHEIGHHLGGYPFKGDRWAASEGQSDYFATQVCARALWREDIARNATFRTSASRLAREACDVEWSTPRDQDLCYRVAMAGKSMADLMGALEGASVDFSSHDPAQVPSTSVSHPAAQCRLDTYVAGALCTVLPNLDVIPGSQAMAGGNSAMAELEAAAWSCAPASAWLETPTYNGSDRPRCWFKNQLDGTP